MEGVGQAVAVQVKEQPLSEPREEPARPGGDGAAVCRPHRIEPCIDNLIGVGAVRRAEAGEELGAAVAIEVHPGGAPLVHVVERAERRHRTHRLGRAKPAAGIAADGPHPVRGHGAGVIVARDRHHGVKAGVAVHIDELDPFRWGAWIRADCHGEHVTRWHEVGAVPLHRADRRSIHGEDLGPAVAVNVAGLPCALGSGVRHAEAQWSVPGRRATDPYRVRHAVAIVVPHRGDKLISAPWHDRVDRGPGERRRSRRVGGGVRRRDRLLYYKESTPRRGRTPRRRQAPPRRQAPLRGRAAGALLAR